MKLNINGYEVEIKAKRRFDDRANKQATMFLLNSMAVWSSEAAKQMKSKGCNALAAEYDEASTEIYNVLKAAGLYKNN